MTDNKFDKAGDIEDLAPKRQVDSIDIGDINDQWEQIELNDKVGIDPAEGGGTGKVVGLSDNEATIDKDDGESVTIDVNSAIKISPSEEDADKQDDSKFQAMSKFDDVLNQKFSNLIDS